MSDSVSKAYLAYWVNPHGVKFLYNVEGVQLGFVQLVSDDYSIVVSTRQLFDWKNNNVDVREVFSRYSDTEIKFLVTGVRPPFATISLGGN